MSSTKSYFCDNLLSYSRLKTKEVTLGDLIVGGKAPIVIQSMTTTDTMDTTGTIEQTIRMVRSGCQLVRITAPNIKAAENLKVIKEGLRKKGCDVPLVADIHFTPNAAEISARIVEKVRVNPGNYADRKQFKSIEYTDKSYQEEIQRIADRFSPLVKICKEYGTAMRIGCNHGSLSDRILSRYGDTPLGMVEAAMEFVRICQDMDYHKIILSMKSSNPTVMVHAYRLLVERMKESEHVYPLHLGVTEAGEGEDGRIKSAIGIGTLLGDGIGDTVRVSLTEDPEHEAPVARAIVDYFSEKLTFNSSSSNEDYKDLFPAHQIKKRKSQAVSDFGGDTPPKVILDYSEKGITEDVFVETGFEKLNEVDKWRRKDVSLDALYLGSFSIPPFLPPELKVIVDYSVWDKNSKNAYPFFTSRDIFKNRESESFHLNFLKLSASDIEENLKKEIANLSLVLVIVLKSDKNAIFEYRQAALRCEKYGIDNPLIWMHSEEPLTHEEPSAHDKIKLTEGVSAESSYQIMSACTLGSILIDGFTSGVWSKNHRGYAINALFGLYQSVRLRISRTEYISCPSCGRTLFDLQEVTAKIRKKTEHLKGVKIGIMGCIVNGPGEMADADFGYVGTGPGKISLYKGQEIVERNINEDIAVDKLIELIKHYGAWVEPQLTS